MSLINRGTGHGNIDMKKIYLFAKWMSWIFLAASVLFLIYTYYRAEIINHGVMVDRYFKYYMVSLTGIFFWAFVLQLREKILANIVTVAISLTVGLYLIEGGLTLLVKPSYLATESFDVKYDDRTKLEMIEDLAAQGVYAVPAVGPRDLLSKEKELLPLGGVSNKVTIGINENGYYMTYISDRYGFNNPDYEWDATQVEWLLTGDSYTEGIAVRSGEDISGQIRSITHQPVINLGRSGNGPVMEIAELIEYAEVVKPKRVLWVYYEGNDLRGDLQRDKLYPMLMQYMEDGFSQNLIHRQKEIDSRLMEFISSQVQPYKTRWIRLFELRKIIDFDGNIDSNIDDNVDVNPLFTKILTKAKAKVEAWGGQLYFVYLPEYRRYRGTIISHDMFRKKSEVIGVVKGLNIPVIDIHQEVFADYTDPLDLFPYHLTKATHYNRDGYAKVAKAVVEGVNKHEKSKE